MPSAERAVAMKEDLSFKEKSLQSSKTTQERLESELQKRQKELEKSVWGAPKRSVSMWEQFGAILASQTDPGDWSGFGGHFGDW